MKFGGQTVTFVTITEDLDDRDDYGNPREIRTEVPVPGCRFRPLTAKEKVEFGYNTVADPWRCTAPPVPAVMAAGATGELIYDGVTYEITGGARTFPNFAGKPFKVTIICERREV
ncbi:head closure [Mycobacterium phage Omega]|uniref:Head-to-tail stopper n=1 Tax=Mycobacterium phage Omega TaxID=2907835 RepID=Q854N8_BPMOM|nr:head closure [Mycobacterium phage Omega]AAN12670.1 head-to-tail stopper [Mycobacterium phage Omega]ASD53417.1 head-to-tail stopper [Mycobacterium phage Lucky2013]